MDLREGILSGFFWKKNGREFVVVVYLMLMELIHLMDLNSMDLGFFGIPYCYREYKQVIFGNGGTICFIYIEGPDGFFF